MELDSSPVNTSILYPMTTLGVDDWLFLGNCIQALVITAGTYWLFWPLLSIGVHFLLMLVTKLMPNLLECYIKYSKQANRYEPGFSPYQRRGLRPLGFGRKAPN